jgi:hypothetical protein
VPHGSVPPRRTATPVVPDSQSSRAPTGMGAAPPVAMPPTIPIVSLAAATEFWNLRRHVTAGSPPATQGPVRLLAPMAIRARRTSPMAPRKAVPACVLTSASRHAGEAIGAVQRVAPGRPTAIARHRVATVRSKPRRPAIRHRRAQPVVRATAIPVRLTSWSDRRTPAPPPVHTFRSCVVQERKGMAAAPPNVVRPRIRIASARTSRLRGARPAVSVRPYRGPPGGIGCLSASHRSPVGVPSGSGPRPVPVRSRSLLTPVDPHRS